ncbi:MAG: Sjogren's syndrome/scleroderma autoantigen 1 family protein [Candidatus Caldarchaeum sp.]
MGSEDDYIRRMSDALRSGAKMLSEVCPICNSPLFEVRGELRCIRCDKPVVIVREESEVMAASTPLVLTHLENALAAKIDALTALLQKATEPEQIRELTETLTSLLKLFHESRRLSEILRKTQ